MAGIVTPVMCRVSRKIHNGYYKNADFPAINVQDERLQEAGAIIAKHQLMDTFLLVQLHLHQHIPEGHILLGQTLTKLSAYWSRIVKTPDELSKISLSVLSVYEGTLAASGFHESPPAVSFEDKEEFFSEITACICKHKLENILGLEVIRSGVGRKVEYTYDGGTVVLSKDRLPPEPIDSASRRVTAWRMCSAGKLLEEQDCYQPPDEPHRPIASPPPSGEVTKPEVEDCILSLYQATSTGLLRN